MAKKPDSFYFDNYVACADLAVQAAELLTKIFENFDRSSSHRDLETGRQPLHLLPVWWQRRILLVQWVSFTADRKV